MKKFDAFISYESTSGQSIAMQLCDFLEKSGLKCWIAPRDIQYGEVYAGIISGAIKSSEFIVCVYTENYNKSKNVKREVELANANQISILPLVTCDVPFDADLEYYFAAHQQIRVSKSNLERGFSDVLTTIERVVKKESVHTTPETELRKQVETKQERSFKAEEKEVKIESNNGSKKKIILYSCIAIAVAAIAVALIVMLKPKEEVAEAAEVIEEVVEERLEFTVNDVRFAVVLINDTMYAGETEVTQGLWTAVMGNSVEEQRDKADPTWATRGSGDDCPMYYVNLEECKEFASKLSMITGKRFELPTENEWEMCIKENGESDIEETAWYAENSGESVHPVGRKRANGLGLYDMAGNVCEWCNTEEREGQYVCRGGDWCMPRNQCGVKMKDCCDAEMRRSSLGFRIVMKTDK